MTGIRQRKGHLLKAGFIGAMIVGLPLLIMTVLFFYGNQAARQQIKEYQKKEAGQLTYPVYILKNDKLPGEKIESSDLQCIDIIGHESDIFQVLSSRDTIGKSARIALHRGMVLTDALVTDEFPEKDTRKLEFSYIQFPQSLKEGEFVDIRISFPNGEDYIVVGNKRALSVGHPDNAGGIQFLELMVGEEELLKLASAKTDAEQYPNTIVYAVKYVAEEQEKPIDTYPVNPFVYQLSQWDPNVVQAVIESQNIQYRQTLEENLLLFLQSEAN